MSQITNNFCPACGAKLLATAVVCPGCGSYTSLHHSQYYKGRKSRTTALVLAFLLAGWAFLYTYKRDAVGFWLYIVFGTLAILGGFAFWGLVQAIFAGVAIIMFASRDRAFFDQYPNR